MERVIELAEQHSASHLPKQTPAESEQFCRERGVLKEFDIVRRLAEASFGAPVLKYSVAVDPESGEYGIIIRVAVQGKTVDEALETYYGLIENLVREIPSDVRRLFCVSLDFQS